jgi:hypothetical protein
MPFIGRLSAADILMTDLPDVAMLLRRASSSGDQLLLMIEWFSVVRPLSGLGKSCAGDVTLNWGVCSKLANFRGENRTGKAGAAKPDAVKVACFVMSLRMCIELIKGALVP